MKSVLTLVKVESMIVIKRNNLVPFNSNFIVAVNNDTESILYVPKSHFDNSRQNDIEVVSRQKTQRIKLKKNPSGRVSGRTIARK